MFPVRRAPHAIALAALALLLTPGASQADGLPVPVETSGSSVQAPGGEYRYFSIPSDRGRTSAVLRMTSDGTAILQQRFIQAAGGGALPYVIPAVATDGTVGGLSADGGTVALIEPRRGFPRRVTRFLLLDGRTLQVVDTIKLEGDFSFDAISRDGATLYLAHYLDKADPSRYEIRSYDVSERRLNEEPIVDHEIVEIQMRGLPMTRATSPDGLWEYTMYDGNYKTPFVHALNVDTGHALCIDLSDHLGKRGLPPALDLDPSGSTLTVTSRTGNPVAEIDTASFDVTGLDGEPAASEDGESGSSSGRWIGLALAVAILGAAAAFLLVRRRRRRRSRLAQLHELDFHPGDPQSAELGRETESV